MTIFDYGFPVFVDDVKDNHKVRVVANIPLTTHLGFRIIFKLYQFFCKFLVEMLFFFFFAFF